MVDRVNRVLLIDDDEDDYILVRDLLLAALGNHCTIDWVASYGAAIDALSHGSYDVCLLDYRLGERDGLDLLQEIHLNDCQFPIIFLTGQGDRRVDMKAMEAGVSDYLAKDEISPVLIERSIRYAIEAKKTECRLKDNAAKLELKNSELMEAMNELHGIQEELREKNRRLQTIHDQLRHQNEELFSAHEEVKVERLRYLDLFDNAPDGYILTDEQGTIQEINRQAESLLHIGRDQAEGLSIVSFAVYPDRKMFRERLEKLRYQRSIRGWQVQILPQYAEPFHADISATFVLPGANEGPAIRWSIRDISQSKRIESELGKHREKLEELIARRTAELERAKAEMEQKAVELDAALNSMADGIMIIGNDGRISRINTVGEFLFGYTPEWHHMTIEQRVASLDIRSPEGEVLLPEQLPVVMALHGQQVISRHLHVRRKDNDRTRSIVMSASPIQTREGESLGVIATFTDVTQQMKLTEELRKARDDLEIRVRERTAELTLSNEALLLEIEERSRTQSALAESEKQLRFLSSKLLTAQEEERKRISREIHDSIGSSLSAIKLGLESAMDKLGNSPEASGVLGPIVSIAQGAIDEARRIMTDLRPSIIDDLGIGATISWLCRQCRTVSPQIYIEEEIDIEESEVPEYLKIIIFRVVQEALNNIRKYSRAELVNLSLCRKGKLIELAIEDNGVGFDIDANLSQKGSEKGIGLTSMKERTELFGGSFAIDSTPGEGTIVRASWPWRVD